MSLRALAPSLVRWAVGPFLLSCVLAEGFHILGWPTLLCAVPAIVASVVAHAPRLAVVAAARRNSVPTSFRPWFETIERLPALSGPASVAGPYRGRSGVSRTRG